VLLLSPWELALRDAPVGLMDVTIACARMNALGHVRERCAFSKRLRNAEHGKRLPRPLPIAPTNGLQEHVLRDAQVGMTDVILVDVRMAKLPFALRCSASKTALHIVTPGRIHPQRRPPQRSQSNLPCPQEPVPAVAIVGMTDAILADVLKAV